MQKETFSNNFVFESSEIANPPSPLNIPSDCVPSDEAFETVVENIISDGVLDFCLQVQRASRVWLFRNEVDEMVDNQAEDIFGQKKGNIKVPRIDCPYCLIKIEPRRFAHHLEKCKTPLNRQKARKAAKRMKIDIQDSDIDEDDDIESDGDASYGSSSKKKSKNKSKKGSNKKRPSKDPSVVSSASFESSQKVLLQTFGSYKQLFNQCCGVRTRHKNTMCMNSPKCSQHAEELKVQIRREFLPNCIAEPNDAPIDVVDTVEEESSAVDLSQSISKGSSPEFLHNSE